MRRRWGWTAAALYFLLLVVSRHVRDPDPHRSYVERDERAVLVAAVDGDSGRTGAPIRIVFRDTGSVDSAAVVLLHGSPGDNGAMRRVGVQLAQRFRVIAPDFPGFGGSSRDVPDYSFRAHARYTLQLLDSLGVEAAHFVGFSMGGGVVLSLYDIAPERVRSAVMLSAIGVQELELMGEYYLNHAVHGIQLAGLWVLREATPHMGVFDRGMMSVEYARNFYDSDQRPLRKILEQFEPPMLILHGDRDPLVLPAVAREHRRIVPHAELVMLEGNHFMVFRRPGDIAPEMVKWVERVEANRAPRRADAEPERVREAARPLDRSDIPPAEGFTLAVLVALIIASTLVLEDLACIGTGLMVARGTIGFWPGTAACVVGLYIGDVLLYLAGRFVGRRLLRVAPFRWIVREADVDRSSTWFERRGLAFVFVSRFSPGTRLPTYFAAGTLRTSFFKFSAFFLGAIVIWTPILVGVSAVFGSEMRALFSRWQGSAVWAVLVTVVVFLLIVKIGVPALTHRGRRLLYSRWHRMTRWEFWPPWVFYGPVCVYVLWLGVRYRSLSLFTAANPAIELGGFIGESKSALMRRIAAVTPDVVPPFLLLDADAPTDAVEDAVRFVGDSAGGFPAVVKPDQGERGRGVRIVASADELRAALRETGRPTIVQAFQPGLEFGVFYSRHPDADRGTIFSITDKRFPEVTGDGIQTLEDLILAHERGVLSARFFLRRHASRLADVPARGERIALAELGTHCRGAFFLDGSALITEQLTEAIDRISRGIGGFTFGRYDVRVPSVEDLTAGRHLRVIELNGATSEATHIYDPKHSLWYAYRTLFRQWRILFEIGAAHRAAGVRPAGTMALVRALIRRLDAEPSVTA